MKKLFINLYKILRNILFFILKFLFCLTLSMLIVYFDFIALTISFEKYNWQIIFYVLFSIFAFFSIWFVIFAKIKIKKRLALGFLFLVWFFSPKMLPFVMQQFELDSCNDTGICREGIINMQDKKGNAIPITKENCINNGYKWYEEDKSCNLNKK